MTERTDQLQRDKAAVEEVNTEFYGAFERGDIDAMTRIWLDDRETLCVHPGTTPLRGASAITRSWALLMANATYIQFFLTDVEVSVHGDVASVTCMENVLTADEHTADASFIGARAVATNVFVRERDTWRLWIHHASPVMSDEHLEE
ncbi:MAG TPA: nuclear transport factor 2 family protein [Nocardioidaceae bacterium]|jgi:ketosteroid isomerase-like protein|nr:nuclear transport factor 2 family protein [Nocardioidaceae bacterium]